MKIVLGVLFNGQSGTLIAGAGRHHLYEGKFSAQSFLVELQNCLTHLGLSKQDVHKIYLTPPFSLENQSNLKPIFHLRLVPEHFNTSFSAPRGIQKKVEILQVTPEKLIRTLKAREEQIKKAQVVSLISPFAMVYPEKENKALRVITKFTPAVILKSQNYPHLGFREREKALLMAAAFIATINPYLQQIREFFIPYSPGIFWVENEAVCVTDNFLPQTCGKVSELAPLYQIARGAAVLFGYHYALALFKVGQAFKLFQVQNSVEVSELSPTFSFTTTSSVQHLLASIKSILPENANGPVPIFNFSGYYLADSYPYRIYKLAPSRQLRFLGLLTAPAELTILSLCKQEEIDKNKKKLLKRLQLFNKKHNFLEKPVAFSQETSLRYLPFNQTILKVGLKETWL
ncbi:hypothetical protein [Carboxydothermus hydrogenoformans]|uniref:hypothetical protein n=1 Tax=Carboxydothermus hydrogenoformans TaxID=129958 RepID=UPI00031CE9D4|nr:hypothetical protein [Carboxydothermus hydrogenoformans]